MSASGEKKIKKTRGKQGTDEGNKTQLPKPGKVATVKSKASVSKASVSKASVSKAPASKAPASKAPASKAPASKAPVSKAPASKAPASKAPVSKAPVSKAPASNKKASKPKKKAKEPEPRQRSRKPSVASETAPKPVSALEGDEIDQSFFDDVSGEPECESEISRLCDAYEKQIFDLKQLLEISRSLNSTLDYVILIDSILYTIMGQMKVLKAGLFAKKGLDTPCFTLHRNYQGFELLHDIDYNIREEHPLIRLFQRESACYTMAELESKLGSLEGLESLIALEPTLIVPLKAKGIVNGIIILGEQIECSEYSQYEKEYVLSIAMLAAIAINNAFLFEMTTTDMMTKLRMKHYFYSILLERMESAVKFDRPLCVVMMDIDFFKKFNDTYGHSCGDAVLKQVAKIVQTSIRANDLAARYGGEEFVVLLPDTDIPDALAIAERIRQTIQDYVLDYEGLSLSVTISMGVARYDPNRDISGKTVIDRADKALYMSKSAGRNRVSTL